MFYLPFNQQLHLMLSPNRDVRPQHQSRLNKRLMSVLTGQGNPKNILPTVLTEQVSPVNNLY